MSEQAPASTGYVKHFRGDGTVRGHPADRYCGSCPETVESLDIDDNDRNALDGTQSI